MKRIVYQFSCGTASAVATMLGLAKYGRENAVILNAFIQEESPDNRRFFAECERWFNHPITVLRNEKYSASTDEVWKRKRFMKGPHGAPCSLELKRKLLASASLPDDAWVIGFTSEEEDRMVDLQELNPGREIICPLIDAGLDKSDCRAMVERAGIQLPEMSRRGYDNDNCVGCPKGGQNYWQAIREDFPERFIQIKAIQESIGPGAFFLAFRSGPRKGERMSLADLPAGRGNMAEEPSFSCSFFCEMAEQDIAIGQRGAAHE